jgi:hypothetical protein
MEADRSYRKEAGPSRSDRDLAVGKVDDAGNFRGVNRLSAQERWM